MERAGWDSGAVRRQQSVAVLRGVGRRGPGSSMEKTHFWPRLVEPLPWLQPPAGAEPPAKAWQHCWLNFLVAHQDWRGLAAWVRSLPFSPQTDCVDAFGKSCVDLEKLEHRGLRFCTSYSREVLLQQLGRRGIFCSGDTQDFHALLCRLTLCGKLFGDGMSLEPPKGREVTLASKLPSSDSDEGSLPLDHLLPVGTVSPFHCFFINYCIDNDPRWQIRHVTFSANLPCLCEILIVVMRRVTRSVTDSLQRRAASAPRTCPRFCCLGLDLRVSCGASCLGPRGCTSSATIWPRP